MEKRGRSCVGFRCAQGLVCTKDRVKRGYYCRKPVGVGEGCEFYYNCSKGLVCLNGKKCGKALSEGDSCGRFGDCKASLFCKRNEGKGKCIKRFVAKAVCTVRENKCLNHFECSGAKRISLCEEKKKEGDPCSGQGQCSVGFHCKNKKCVISFKEGDTCSYYQECQEGLGCDRAQKKCMLLPSEGKPCLNSPVLRCAKSLTCFIHRGKQATCEKVAGDGESCTNNTNCLLGFGCGGNLSTGKKCVKHPKVGEKCGRVCADSFCNRATRKCEAYHSVGSSCRLGECGPTRSCVLKKGQRAYVCVPIPKKGEVCVITCAGGLFCGHVEGKGICQPNICTKVM